jgi:hypothetical protein
MLIKIFFKDNSVAIYNVNDFRFDSVDNSITLVRIDFDITLDRDKIKNYTIYSDTGQQIHTTYSKKHSQSHENHNW